MKTKKLFNTRQLVLLGLMTALVLIFSLTPIGSIPIGPLSITLNVIPVAIAAIALGPVGGAVIGGVFGLFSFLQCFGVGVPSGMGAVLAEINPFLAFVQRFIPRLLDGLLVGFIFRAVSSIKSVRGYYIITGIVSAGFGFALYMSGMLLLNFETNESGKSVMSVSMTDFIDTPSLFIPTCIFVAGLSFGVGFLLVSSKKLSQKQVACAITGFCTALLNTIFFMTALVALFGDTEYMQNLIAGRNILMFIIAFVGVNALFEMMTTTIITAAVGPALFKAKMIPEKKTAAE
ncbi:MAG: ECF transporter S component [Ruminococcus sp.]|nr:ECF transporter S component [Ruminococcus sp.]